MEANNKMLIIITEKKKDNEFHGSVVAISYVLFRKKIQLHTVKCYENIAVVL